MNRAFGLEQNGLEIVQAVSQTSFVRRRRNLYGFFFILLYLSANIFIFLFFFSFVRWSRKTKRTVKDRVLFACKPRYSRTCLSPSCRKNVKTQLFRKIEATKSIGSVNCEVSSRHFGRFTKTVTLAFVSLSSTSKFHKLYVRQ